MSSSIPESLFVTIRQYEIDMERLNATLDKLLLYIQEVRMSNSFEAGAASVEKEKSNHTWAAKLMVAGAVLTLVGSFVLNIVQLALK